jgi:hypothetical protein
MIVIILVLFSASAAAGLAIGVAVVRALAIMVASPCVALLSVAILLDHDFGLAMSLLISVGALTALQSSYFLGVWIRLSCAPRLAEIMKRTARRAKARRQKSIAATDDGRIREGRASSYALTVKSAKRPKREAVAYAPDRYRQQTTAGPQRR